MSLVLFFFIIIAGLFIWDWWTYDTDTFDSHGGDNFDD